VLIVTALFGLGFLCLHAANPRRWSVESVATSFDSGAAAGQTAPSASPPQKLSRQERAAKVEARLAEADKASAAAVQKSLGRIHDLMARNKPGATAFARDMLGLEGKARAVIAVLPFTDGDGYTQFVRQAFSSKVLDAGDFSREVDAAVRGFLAELAGIENQMLVAMRLDVGDDELALNIPPPTLDGGASYRDALDRLLAHTASDAVDDALILAIRGAVAWVAAGALTEPLLDLIDQLGLIPSDWLDTGFARLVAGCVIGYVADRLTADAIQAIGHDPEAAVAGKVSESMDALERRVIEGDGADSQNPGLKRVLSELHEKRCRERAAAIRKHVADQ
jgi:hypothetical protein